MARPVRRAALALAVAALGSALLSAQVPQGVETFDAAWTTIRDSHFDKTMNGVNWDGVRAELRPRAAAAKSNTELRAVVRDMLGRLGQSHFALIPSSADAPADASHPSADLSADPGFDVRLVGGELIVTSVDAAAAPAVRPGWRVVEIAGAPIVDLLRTLREEGRSRPEAGRTLPEGANDRLLNIEAWRIAHTRLRGRARSTVDLTFENGQGTPVKVSLERRPEQGQPVTVGSLPTMFVRVESERKQTPGGRTAGVIRFNVWMAAVDAPFQQAVDQFRASDGIIIDLRGNPGGLAGMISGISGHFVGERKTLGVMKTRENELHFNVNPRLVSAAGERVQPYAGPVAILVDAMTGSASECFAGGMQSIGRARVFGQPSMGQALPSLFDRMPNGDVLIHAYGDFVTAEGTRLEGRGVIPDQAVPLVREDLLAGRDRTLDAALAWIDRSRDAAPVPRGERVSARRERARAFSHREARMREAAGAGGGAPAPREKVGPREQ
jgi:carboxyl-terminal processing protease